MDVCVCVGWRVNKDGGSDTQKTAARARTGDGEVVGGEGEVAAGVLVEVGHVRRGPQPARGGGQRAWDTHMWVMWVVLKGWVDGRGLSGWFWASGGWMAACLQVGGFVCPLPPAVLLPPSLPVTTATKSPLTPPPSTSLPPGGVFFGLFVGGGWLIGSSNGPS